MSITSHDRNIRESACRAAVFGSLREKIAEGVSGSAVLADLLEKLNGMQEACARPVDFKERFDEFVARAIENLDIVQPFFPELVRFLPLQMDHQGESEPIGTRVGANITWKVA